MTTGLVHDVSSGWSEDARQRIRQLEQERMSLPGWRITLARSLIVATAVTGAVYITWRANGTVPPSIFGWLFFATEAVSFGVMVLFLFGLRRFRYRPQPPPPPVAGTLDVFICVADEPVDMVEPTMQAALAIEHPHRTYLLNDGCVFGNPAWRELDALARRYGVTALTRRAGPPGKAANLNHALAHTDGDFVCVLDGDHRAAADLGEQMLGYFADPKVGFVATPQVFELEGPDILSNRELVFYRGIQPARDADGFAFSCGTGAVYRRAALDSIGGFSEWAIVEDLHTSYRLHSASWRSVYQPRPVAIGVAPETTSAYIVQRMRWATDGLRILFHDSPLTKPGLPWVARLHYTLNLSFYLVALLQLVFLASPIVYLLGGTEVMSVDAVGYLSHGVPFYVSLVALMIAFGGLRGGPQVFQTAMFLAPLLPLAVVKAWRGDTHAFGGTTAKDGRAHISLLLVPSLLLYLLLLVALAAVVIVWIAPAWLVSVDRFVVDIDATLLTERLSDPRAGVAAVWAGLIAMLMTGPLLALPPRTPLVRPLRRSLHGLLAVAVAVMVAFPAVKTFDETFREGGILAERQVFDSVASPSQSVGAGTTDKPARLAVPGEGQRYLGVYAPDLIHEPTGMHDWSAAYGAPVGLVAWYQQWGSGPTKFQPEWASQAGSQGGVPLITWEPWARPTSNVHDANQPAFRLERIVAGDFDGYVRAWARDVAAYGGPVLLRPMHEMNGTWYPWAEAVNGNRPGDYVQAWRHIHTLFEAQGASNVSWVWSVIAPGGEETLADLRRLYPGDAYVDWVGLSGFNWGAGADTQWRGFAEVFEAQYQLLTTFGKPIMISEVATESAGGDAGRWVRDAVATILADMPQVRALVWFDADYPGAADLRLRGAAADGLSTALTAAGDAFVHPVMVPVE